METDDFDTSMVCGDALGPVYSKLTHHIPVLLMEAKETILSCLESITTTKLNSKDPGPIALADYGTADGGNAVQILNAITYFLHQQLGSEKQVVVTNDFNTLFKLVHSHGKFGAAKTKLNTRNGKVIVLASGTSMYGQCLADNSLDFGMSVISLHWLSRRPCLIEYGVSYTRGSIEEEMFRKQAEKDWTDFLTYREKELKPGGFLYLFLPAENDDADVCLCRSLTFLIEHAIKDILVEKVITQDEAKNINLLTYTRKLSDIKKPFCKSDATFGCLKLQQLSIRLVPVLLADLQTDTTNEMYNTRYASGIVDIVKPWFTHTFKYGLSETRNEDEKNQIMEAFYSKMRLNMEHVEEKLAFTHSFAEIIIQKMK